MKKTLKILLLVAVSATVSFGAGRYNWLIPAKQGPSLKYFDATPYWVYQRECTPLNAAERAKYELAVEALRTYQSPDWMHTAAIKHFARSRVRHHDSGYVSRLCTPNDLLPEVAELTLYQFSPGFSLHANPLRLASAQTHSD